MASDLVHYAKVPEDFGNQLKEKAPCVLQTEVVGFQLGVELDQVVEAAVERLHKGLVQEFSFLFVGKRELRRFVKDSLHGLEFGRQFEVLVVLFEAVEGLVSSPRSKSTFA